MKVVGTVRDNTGETLPGANIFLSTANGMPKANLVGVQSDLNGDFILYTEDQLKDYVTVTFVGYKPVTVSMKDLDAQKEIYNIQSENLDPLAVPFNPVMVPANETLPEFTVVAKKRKLWPYIAGGVGLIILIYFIYRKMK